MGTIAGEYGAVPVRFDAVFIREAFARSGRDERDDGGKKMESPEYESTWVPGHGSGSVNGVLR